jgi:hypothetical protein
MRLASVTWIALALLTSVALAETRTWTSRSGKFTTEAELIDFKDGQVRLLKAAGDTVDVPLIALSEADCEYVKGQYPGVTEEQFRPGVEYREWTSRSGRFKILAEFLGYAGGRVHLRKLDGEEIFVTTTDLSRDDQQWVVQTTREREEDLEEVVAEVEPIEPLKEQTLAMDLVRFETPQERTRTRPNTMTDYALRLTKPQLFYVQFRQRENRHAADFQRVVTREPDYKSSTPFRAVAKLGSGDYAFALDVSEQRSVGYDVLYFDRNGNGDLTDDEPVSSGRPAGRRTSSFAQSQFPRLDFEVDADGTPVDYAALVTAYVRASRTSPYASVSVFAAAVREGYIEQEQQKTRLVLVDQNTNGRFDDKVTVRFSGERAIPSEGDLLLVNPNPRGRLTSDVTMGRDRHFVGRSVCIGKSYYRMEVTPAGDQVRLKPIEMAAGYVINPSPTFRATLYNDDHGVLLVNGMRNARIPLPTGSWKVASYTIDATGLTSRDRTAVSATFGEDYRAIEVTKDKAVDLPFGAPFKAVVSAQRSSTNRVYLSLAFLGVQGERCTSIYVNGERPPKPRFVVRTTDGKNVHQGAFDYG